MFLYVILFNRRMPMQVLFFKMSGDFLGAQVFTILEHLMI